MAELGFNLVGEYFVASLAVYLVVTVLGAGRILILGSFVMSERILEVVLLCLVANRALILSVALFGAGLSNSVSRNPLMSGRRNCLFAENSFAYSALDNGLSVLGTGSGSHLGLAGCMLNSFLGNNVSLLFCIAYRAGPRGISVFSAGCGNGCALDPYVLTVRGNYIVPLGLLANRAGILGVALFVAVRLMSCALYPIMSG